jgi:PadR family transcriptional regulator PadR
VSLSKDLVAASAVPLVLSLLIDGPSYGYAIIKRVRELSGDGIRWSEGMLYPVLHRMETQGWIQSYWQETAGRRRRYYRVTREGRTELSRQREQWELVRRTLDRSRGGPA